MTQNKKEDDGILLTLAGTIGAGKTEWSRKIANHFGTEVLEESVDDNPFLAEYYDDGKNFSFPLQIFFLNKRFQAIKDAMRHPNTTLDRSIYEDSMVFAKLQYKNGSMTKAEYDTYAELQGNMMQELHDLYTHRVTMKKSPDLLILVHGSFDEILRRVRKRGRSFEQPDGDPDLMQYYKDLYEIYEYEFVKEYKANEISPVYTINIDEYETDNPDDVAKIMTDIEEELRLSRGYAFTGEKVKEAF